MWEEPDDLLLSPSGPIPVGMRIDGLRDDEIEDLRRHMRRKGRGILFVPTLVGRPEFLLARALIGDKRGPKPKERGELK